MLMRRLLNAIVRLLARILLHVQVTGLEHVPKDGALMIMINHINFIDGPLVLGLIPRDSIAMTKAETFRMPLLAPLAWLYGVFPVRRGEVDREALRRAEETLAAGKGLLFAPEGHRSGSGALQAAKDGLVYLASRTGTPILPVAVTGVEDFRRNIVRLRRTDVQVTIGAPFRLPQMPDGMPRQVRKEMTAQAMYQLARLMPERYRGAYRDIPSGDDHLIASDA